MMVNFVANSSYLLTKGLGLFETFEGKAAFKVIKIFGSCPTINSSSINNVVDEVLVHFLQFYLTCFIKNLVLNF